MEMRATSCWVLIVGVALAAGCRTTTETAEADPYGAYGNAGGGDYGGYASQQTDYVQVTPTGQAPGSAYGGAGAWDQGAAAPAPAPSGGGYPVTGYAGPQSQGNQYANSGGVAAVANTVASPPSYSPPPSSGRRYTVQKGDTLYRIGRNHGTTADAIVAANAISGTTIYPGQVLTIP
jgi:LysM repeat protein